jgi:hypothetical protein
MRKSFTIRAISFVMYCFLSVATVFAADDAGVQTILTPSSSVCRGNASVTVIIQNLGATTINTVDVHWRVNGANQTMFSYSGLIAAGNQDTVSLGIFNFTGGPFTLNAWTANPNGNADANPSNDTASMVITISNQLTGTYTIGGSSPDFTDITAAVNAMTANGICGPVVFNMRPQVDTLQLIIPQINGVDTNNTVTFQSENGDSTSVILTYPSLDTLVNNYLIYLDGTDYFTFKEITMQRTDTQLNARIIDFANNATHNTITNCYLKGVTGPTTNSLCALIYSSGSTSISNDSMNTFTNNYLKDGSLGIYMNGISSQNLEYYTTIKNNTFDNQKSKGIQMSNQGFANIDGNIFTTTSNYKGYVGVYLDRSLRPHTIVKNQVRGTPGAGMYFVDCTAQSGVHGIIANNFIWSNDSAGISMVNGDYQDVVYNSILMTGTTNTFAALLMRGSGLGKLVKNNILANFGGGYSYVISDSAVFGVQYSNYNDIYTSGSFVGNYNGSNVSNLANWTSISGLDSNSISTNPNFVSNTDLHSSSVTMDDHGKPYSHVLDDIDGDVRGLSTPDIGADEYSASTRNVGVTALINPVDSTCGDASTIVSVVITNTGQLSEQNFQVHCVITGSATQNFQKNHNTSIAAGHSDTLTFNANPINTATGGTYNFKIYTSLNVDDNHLNDTLNVTIHLLPPPTAPTVSNSSICGPGSDTLTATSPDTVLWYSASTGGSPLHTGPTYITPSLNASTTYYVSAKGACEGSRTSVTVNVLPVPNVNLGNDTSINQGQTVNLNAGGGASSYLWSTNQTTQTITVNTDGCYWVRYTNGAGCPDYDTLCVDVIFPSDVALMLNSSPVDGDCAADSIPVMVWISNVGTSVANNIPVNVQLTGAIAIAFSDTIPTLAVGDDTLMTMGYINLLSGGTITMKSYVSFSNDLDPNNDTLTNVIHLIVAPNPPGPVSSSRCGSGPITLNASASDTILWYDSPTGGNLVHVGDSYFIPALNVSTTFYIQTGQVCNNQQRVAINATINPLPVVSLGNDTTVQDSLLLDAGAGFVSYSWSPSGATTQTYMVHGSDQFGVCVTDNVGCHNCDTINVSVILRIEHIGGTIGMNVYPNPARNIVNIEIPSASNDQMLMRIRDMHGREVWRTEGRNMNFTSVNLAAFAKGVYLLQVSSTNATSVYRLVVE